MRRKPKKLRERRQLFGPVRHGVINGKEVVWTGLPLDQVRGYCPKGITAPKHFYSNGRCRCRG